MVHFVLVQPFIMYRLICVYNSAQIAVRCDGGGREIGDGGEGGGGGVHVSNISTVKLLNIALWCA